MARTNRQRTGRESVNTDASPAPPTPEEDIDPDDDRTPEQRAAARERFSSPIISHLWHADGTPFTDEEYRERGIEPPPPGEQEELIILEE